MSERSSGAAAAVASASRAWARRRRPHLLLGCIVAGLALSPAGVGWVLAAGAVGAVLGALAARADLPALVRGAGLFSVLTLAAFAFGCARIDSIDRPARAAPPGSVIDATATLLERPRAGAHGSSAPMSIDTGPARGLRVLARRRQLSWAASDPGTRFALRGLVSPPRRKVGPVTSLYGIRISEANAGRPGTPGFGPLPGPAADDFDYDAFLRSRGIGREVEAGTLVAIGHRGGLEGVVDRIRARAERGLSAGLDAAPAALARGMVLGEDGDIDADTRDDFRRSGLAHLLAASGQNVALLGALVLPLLALAGASQRLRVAVLMPLVFLYVALAGSGASVMRAGLMAAAALVAVAASRRASAVYALLLAATVTLALNPRATADPGWQLSFAAVLGMLVLGPPIRRRLGTDSGRIRAATAEAVAATAAATIATAPLMAHDFGAVSAAALAANVAAFPAVAPIMWLGMTSAALEQLAALGAPLAWVPHAAQAVTAPVEALALHWVAAVARRFADPAWSQLHTHPGWPAVLAAYGLALAVVIAARRMPPLRPSVTDRSIDWLRSLSPASRRAFVAPFAALALGAAAWASEPPRPPRQATVDFLDVGQGDSTLVRDSTGAAVLFDGGIPEARVDRTLERLGVRRVSVVVATHQSRDHHGGLLQVVKRFPVGLFLDGRYGSRDPTFLALEQEVDRRHIPRRDVRAGQHLQAGQIDIQILWPPPRGNAPAPADPNTRAAVAIVRIGAFSLFLSADAEAPVLLPLELPAVDAMKVPHHGSAEDGLSELLARLRPKVAAIECGRGNPFAHPRPSTLQALRVVPRVFRTDRDGTVELGVTDDRIAIRTHR